jgi:ATP-binding cassette subfamily E protein 1
MKAVIKRQFVDQIPKAVSGVVSALLDHKNERHNKEDVCRALDLSPEICGRNVSELSGGELQRFAIAMVCLQSADVFMFDEPSSYLDVKQRLKAAQVIRELIQENTFVVVVEHDLSVLDYLSDYICCLYGVPGAYGVVTLPISVGKGINIFLDGYYPTENLRFRDSALDFKVSETGDEKQVKRLRRHEYQTMVKRFGQAFELTVQSGAYTESEIIVLLGENGTGKTTFIRMLAGHLKPDGTDSTGPTLAISYKPQKISAKFDGNVRKLLTDKMSDTFIDPQFQTEVVKPLQIDNIIDQEVVNLSGGELQRVALVLCLGRRADVYLIDEPSAYLDCEQRLVAAKVIKRFLLHSKKTGFIVEHDFLMATYLADRVVVFEGQPSVKTVATSPQTLLSGMNRFLRSVNITFRRDATNFRPRINKLNSIKDIQQKKSGNYFFLD